MTLDNNMITNKFEQYKNNEVMRAITKIAKDLFNIKFENDNTYIIRGSKYPFEINLSPTSIDLTIEEGKRYFKLQNDKFYYSKNLENQENEDTDTILEALLETILNNDKAQVITVKANGEKDSKFANLDQDTLELKMNIIGVQLANGNLRTPDYVERIVDPELATNIAKSLSIATMFFQEILDIDLKEGHNYTFSIDGEDRKVVCDSDYLQVNFDGDEYKIVPKDFLCTLNGDESEFDFPEMMIKFGYMFMDNNKFKVDDYYNGEHTYTDGQFDDLMATIKLTELMRDMNDDTDDDNTINVHLHL